MGSIVIYGLKFPHTHGIYLFDRRVLELYMISIPLLGNCVTGEYIAMHMKLQMKAKWRPRLLKFRENDFVRQWESRIAVFLILK